MENIIILKNSNDNLKDFLFKLKVMLPYGSSLIGIAFKSLKTEIQPFVQEVLDYSNKHIITISKVNEKIKVIMHYLSKGNIIKSKNLKFNFVNTPPSGLLFTSSWYIHIIINIEDNVPLIDLIEKYLEKELIKIDHSIGLYNKNIAISKTNNHKDKDIKLDVCNHIKLLQHHINDKIPYTINKKYIKIDGFIYSHILVKPNSDNILWDAINVIKNDLKQSLSYRIDLLKSELQELQKRLLLDEVESFTLPLPKRLFIKRGKDIIATPYLKECSINVLEDIRVFGVDKKDLLIFDNEEINKSFNIKMKKLVQQLKTTDYNIDNMPLKKLTTDTHKELTSSNVFSSKQFALSLLIIIVSVILYIININS